MNGNRLARALASFAETERGIVQFGLAGDTERAVELIRLRKQMVTDFAALGQALEAERHLAEDPTKKTEILRLFAAFRTTNALNTAEWPAIRVRDDVASFRVAAKSVGLSTLAFWDKVRSELRVSGVDAA